MLSGITVVGGAEADRDSCSRYLCQRTGLKVYLYSTVPAHGVDYQYIPISQSEGVNATSLRTHDHGQQYKLPSDWMTCSCGTVVPRPNGCLCTPSQGQWLQQRPQCPSRPVLQLIGPLIHSSRVHSYVHSPAMLCLLYR